MNLQVTFQGFYFSHFSVEVFHNFLHGKLTKFALIINKFILSYYVLPNQSLKLVHKCGLHSEIVWVAIFGTSSICTTTSTY